MTLPADAGPRRPARVTVYAGSSAGNRPAFARDAAELGRRLAQAGIGIVYGGGAVGLMGVVADAALAAGGSVVGVIPRALVDAEVAHHALTELRVVDSMHERKRQMAELGDCFVALPGGVGTIEEILEAWAWLILGDHAKPVLLLNTEGYWDPLLAMTEHVASAGFLRPAERASLVAVAGADELLDRYARWRPPAPRWGGPTDAGAGPRVGAADPLALAAQLISKDGVHR